STTASPSSLSSVLASKFKQRDVAGCIVSNPIGTHVVLVTSKSYPDHWILPKGGYKDPSQHRSTENGLETDVDMGKDESLENAAARETLEEAGILKE
ncbi:hypothetical protein HMI55_004683, partial [Coelomomyces lativittatus]